MDWFISSEKMQDYLNLLRNWYKKIGNGNTGKSKDCDTRNEINYLPGIENIAMNSFFNKKS